MSHIAKIGDVGLVGSAKGCTEGFASLIFGCLWGSADMKEGKDWPNFELATAKKGHRRVFYLKLTKTLCFCPRSCPVVVAVQTEHLIFL